MMVVRGMGGVDGVDGDGMDGDGVEIPTQFQPAS